MPRRARKNDTPRSQVLTFRVTIEERAALEADAKRAGMVTLSEYLTAVVVRRKVKFVEPDHKRIDPALLAEMRRWGNNLNQLAHAANAGLPPDGHRVVKATHRLLATVLEDELMAKRMAHARESMNGDDGTDPRQWVPARTVANEFGGNALKVWDRAGRRDER